MRKIVKMDMVERIYRNKFIINILTINRKKDYKIILFQYK